MGSVHEANYHDAIDRLFHDLDHDANRELVEDYLAEKMANGVKPATCYNNAVCLRDLSKFLDKDLRDADKKDIIRFVNHRTRTRHWRHRQADGTFIESTKEVRLSDNTMALRKQMLRTFYKWLLGDGKRYPDNVEWLKTARPNKDRIPTDALLTDADMEALITSHAHPRDKALLAVLYESGLRASELCALRIGNVERDEHGFVVLLPKDAAGLKTGARRIRLYHEESGPYLFAWLEVHPDRLNKQAPLFPSNSRRNPGAPLNPQSLYQFAKRAGMLAGIGKKLNPHLFRHTAATQRASQGWTEAELRAFFGWTRGSDMPSTYVHLAGKDYEEMDFQRRGIIVQAGKSKSALAPRMCRVCKTANLPTAMYCQSCRRPVSPGAEEDMATSQTRLLSQLVEQELRRHLELAAAN